MISTLSGNPVGVLGLAARPDQDQECIPRARDAGINFFFFYGPGHKQFVAALRPLLRAQRDEMIVATGSGARKPGTLRAARRRIVSALGADAIDVFFAEYVNPRDDPAAIFGSGGVLDELQHWKGDGTIRFVGASAHDRALARQLAEDSRVDLLLHRFNMAHRKATDEVFPFAVQSQTPVIAFTATRWSTLLDRRPEWSGDPPTAADCYRFCLAQPAVRLVLTAPATVGQLNANLAVLQLPRMSRREYGHWERFGNIVYGQQREADAFESRWP